MNKKIMATFVAVAFLLCACSSFENLDRKDDDALLNEAFDESAKLNDITDVPYVDEKVDDELKSDEIEKTVSENTDQEVNTEIEIVDNGKKDILQILHGDLTVVESESKKEVVLFELSLVNDNYMGEPYRYVITDFDENGVMELVVEHSLGGDTAIIHKYGDKWYAHYEPFRAVAGLTTKGYVSWSNSAFNSGISKISFIGEGVFWLEVLESDTWDEEKPLYYVNGQEVSIEEYVAIENQLDKGHVLHWNDI